MTKFLNESGFRRIIKTIKNALSLKADKSELPLLVTYNGSQCDTSIADIYAAFLAGRGVEMNYGYLFKLSLVQCSEEGAIFSANFGDQSIGIKGTISNGVDTWEFSLVDLQGRLNSGTNIKTVNSQTLLGSGDILLNAATIGTSPSGNYDGDPIEEVLDEKQDSLVSGTNIKTVAGNSLLGSGDVTLEAFDIQTEGGVSVQEWMDDTEYEIDKRRATIEYESKATMDADGSQPNGTIGYDQNKEEWYIFDRPNGEWRRIDNEELNQITSITTTESTASGGNNTVTINTTDGISKTFNVKNGKDGKDGQDGADGVSLGEVALVQTTGDSEESVMSQKAVTDELIFPDMTITESDFDDWKENYYFAETGRINSSDYACNEKFVDIRNYDKISFSGQNIGIFRVILYNKSGEFLSQLNPPSSGAIYTRSVYPEMAYFRIYTSKTVYQSATFTFTLSEGHSTREDVADIKRSDIQVLHTAFQCNQDKAVKVYEGARMTNKTIVIFANAFNSYLDLTTGTINISYAEGWCTLYKNDSIYDTLCRFSQNRGQTKQSISMILTFDDTGNMKVYLNGILKASCTYDNLPDDGWNLYLGRQIMSHFSIINCALDDYLKVIERNGWMDWLPSLAWNQNAASINATVSKGGWIGYGYRKGALVHALIELTNNTSSAVSYRAMNMYKYPSGDVSVAAGTTETVDCLIDMRQQASFGVFGSTNQANLSASATGDYVVFEWGMDYRYCRNGGHYNLAGLKWEDVPPLGLLNQEMVKKVCEPEHTYSNTGSAVGQISVDSNGNLHMFNGTVWKQINNS